MDNQKASYRERAREREYLEALNRSRYPEIARVVDEVRKSFPQAKVTAVRFLSRQECEDRLRWIASQRPGEGR
jgi:hypothetical protein